MARVTHVKKARQRYETVPVLDGDGQPRRSPVMVTKKVWSEHLGVYLAESVQKTTKRGKPVTMAVTRSDKSRPLPNLRCDAPGCTTDGGEILVGAPYKHITPRSGPYGGTQRNRHEGCPTWQVWEYSHSVSAQAAQAQHEMHEAIDAADLTTESDFEDLVSEVASMAQDFASEREEAVSNMPEQLQDGSQAQEYLEAAEAWAEEIEQATADDAEYEDCEPCEGTGTVDEECDTCSGSGEVEDDDEPGGVRDCDDCSCSGDVEEVCRECDEGKTDVLTDDWAEAAKDAIREAVDGLGI